MHLRARSAATRRGRGSSCGVSEKRGNRTTAHSVRLMHSRVRIPVELEYSNRFTNVSGMKKFYFSCLIECLLDFTLRNRMPVFNLGLRATVVALAFCGLSGCSSDSLPITTPLSSECSSGAVHSCDVLLSGSPSTTVTCGVGTQTCVGGSWGACNVTQKTIKHRAEVQRVSAPNSPASITYATHFVKALSTTTLRESLTQGATCFSPMRVYRS